MAYKKPKKRKTKPKTAPKQSQKQTVIVNIGTKSKRATRQPKQTILYPPTPSLVYQPPPPQPERVTLGDLRNVISQFTQEFKTAQNTTQEPVKITTTPTIRDYEMEDMRQDLKIAMEEVERLQPTQSQLREEAELRDVITRLQPQLSTEPRRYLNDTGTIGGDIEPVGLEPITPNVPSSLQSVDSFDSIPIPAGATGATSATRAEPSPEETGITNAQLIENYKRDKRSVLVADLKGALSRMGERVGGNKDELFQRLVKKVQ
tara:strand:- start:111 stop:893 length:783 start_codon:yes stop_codon:yes gene_type:complete